MPLPVVFVDYASSFWQAKTEAEIYMRLYQYAAEDFRTVADCKIGHTLVNTWMTNTNTSMRMYQQQVQAHTHVAPQGATSPPVAPAQFQTIPAPPVPISKTLRPENHNGNFVIPASNLSYIDLSITGVNIAYPTFRRAEQISIAIGPVSMAIRN